MMNDNIKQLSLLSFIDIGGEVIDTNNRLGDLTLEEYRKLKYEEEVFKLTAEEKYGPKKVIVVRGRFYDEVSDY